MNEEARDSLIECPRCGSKSCLSKWKIKHETGQLAEVACSVCGWHPTGEGLVAFRRALAFFALADDLRRRKDKRGVRRKDYHRCK